MRAAAKILLAPSQHPRIEVQMKATDPLSNVLLGCKSLLPVLESSFLDQWQTGLDGMLHFGKPPGILQN